MASWVARGRYLHHDNGAGPSLPCIINLSVCLVSFSISLSLSLSLGGRTNDWFVFVGGRLQSGKVGSLYVARTNTKDPPLAGLADAGSAADCFLRKKTPI